LKNKDTYLVVTPFFPSNESFVGSYVYDQIAEIKNQSNFSIEIVKVVSYFSSESDYEFNGFKVKTFKTFDFPYFILPGLFNSCNKRRFSKFLKKKNITNVSFSHSHVSYPAAYLVEDLACKKIVQHHGLDVLQLLNGRSNFIKKLQGNYLIKKTIRQLNKLDLNIGVSELVLNQLRKYPTYSPKDELVLYNGVNTSKFYPIEVKKNEIFTIGCVANFWEIKDQITLIKAVEILLSKGEKILLRFIGSGPKLDECYNYVKEHNLDSIISFEREKEHSALNIFYNEIELFVLPSYYEALGCVYLESWATNTAFIGIENQGIHEIAPDKMMMLAKAKDVHDLSDKIKLFMNSDFRLETFSHFDIKQTISDFLELNIFRNND
jgi:glycosyltransferase involved in cell wall biosynthesis